MLLPNKGKELLSIIVAILSLATIIALLYCSVLYYIDLGSNQIAPTLGIQMKYLVLCVPIGMATPPFGLCMYLAANMSGQPVIKVAKKILPMSLVQLACVVLFIAVPWFS